MGNLESVRMLLRVSVKIDSRNEISKTPMHLAAENGHVPLALSLLLSFSRVFPSYTFIITLHFTHSLLIHLLTHTYKHKHRVVRELMRYQVDTIQDEDEDGNSPLHLACINGHVGVVKVLIAANCDVEARLVNQIF